MTIASPNSSAETERSQLPLQAGPKPGQGFVCMIAYTNYAIDARVRREAETLVASGFHVRCLTATNGEGRSRRVVNGVEVRELSVPKYRGKSTFVYMCAYLLFLIYASVACLRLLVQNELDIVHVHNLPDFLVLAALIPRMLGRKVILDVHDSMPETFATKFSGSSVLYRALCAEERLSALLAHRVICVNHPQRDTLVARGIPSEKTFISMNMPDPRIFHRPTRIETQPALERTFNLVYHGTMASRLGVDLIIRAVETLRPHSRDIRLHLWGNGDDLPSLKGLVRELSLEDVVRFNPKGYPLEELPDHLRHMHLGVVGNRRSFATDLMLPVKLLEYVSLGIPVVAPRLRTIEYYFSDDKVFYYEPENVDSLVECIKRVRCQPELARAQAERARGFLDDYGWERKGAELVALYQSLVKRERI